AVGLKPGMAIADIGAGTGISAKLFLEAGNEVWAIEPNDAMREASTEFLKSFDRFHPINGRSEATTLPEKSIDLVVAAQAFHWFDRDAFKQECKRIVTSRGHLLLMWNDRMSTGSPFLESYEELLNDFGTDYREVNHQQLHDESIAKFFAPAPMKIITLPNQQLLDESGLIARLMSSSYVPQSGTPKHQPMLDRASQIFRSTNVNGFVTMTYDLKLYLGQIGAN
ncbi:MAG TPA: methyltransferase domain-containing protein, partial [Tepidisphaeraceae bacterium]|nr:methyltransferase domain-containing protein [Tepidisphaeraceae bacterium]